MHGGRQHLFFQEHPHAPAWGPPQWGHVSSGDLVHWHRHPTAFAPSPHGPDRDGCWSGCVVLLDGRPTAFYTGVTGSTDADRREQVCVATALDDRLEQWQVQPEPVLARRSGFARDPAVWQDDDGWHLLLGVAGGVDHHRSPDGRAWERTGRFWDDPTGSRHVECPQLLRLDGADVLVVSLQAGTHERPELRVVHAVGRAEGGRFTGALAGPLEHGDALYAPAVCREPGGRWLLWGWLRELVPERELAALGRVGALSLPMACTLEDGRLVLRPVPELAALRARRVGPGRLPRQAEVEAELGEGTVVLELSPGGGEAVVLERTRGVLAVRTGRADLRVPVAAGPRRLRVLLDGSVLVVCVDDVLVAVTRVYPASPVTGGVVASGDVTALVVRSLSAD